MRGREKRYVGGVIVWYVRALVRFFVGSCIVIGLARHDLDGEATEGVHQDQQLHDRQAGQRVTGRLDVILRTRLLALRQH